jgi:uncharacterized protein YqkB
VPDEIGECEMYIHRQLFVNLVDSTTGCLYVSAYRLVKRRTGRSKERSQNVTPIFILTSNAL